MEGRPTLQLGDVLYPSNTNGFPLLWVTVIASGAFRGLFVDPRGGYCDFAPLPGIRSPGDEPSTPSLWHRVGHVPNPPLGALDFRAIPVERLPEFLPAKQQAESLGYTVVSWF
jgi:hypothetical protein